MKRLIIVLVIGFMLLATGFGGGPVQALAAKAKTLNFAILSYLTGPAAPWGIKNFRSITLGAWKVNEEGGFKVKGTTYKWNPITYDTKYIPAEAVKAANKAIYSDKVKYMAVGGGANAVACLPLLKENKMLSLNFAGGGKMLTNPKNPLAFRYNPAIEGMYAALVPYFMKNAGMKTMAVINPDDATGRSGLDAARLVAGMNSVKIVAEEFFERGSKEFTPLLTRVIAKKPDMIETSYTDPTSAALMCKQARELGYKGIFMLSWGPDPEQVLKIAGPHAEGAYMVLAGLLELQTPEQKAVFNKFSAKWPADEWDPMILLHLDLIPCLTKAIVETQSFDSFILAKHLENMKWDSPMGILRFGGYKIFGIKRQLLYFVPLYQYQEGKPVFMGMPPIPPGILD